MRRRGSFARKAGSPCGLAHRDRPGPPGLIRPKGLLALRARSPRGSVQGGTDAAGSGSVGDHLLEQQDLLSQDPQLQVEA